MRGHIDSQNIFFALLAPVKKAASFIYLIYHEKRSEIFFLQKKLINAMEFHQILTIFLFNLGANMHAIIKCIKDASHFFFQKHC